MSTSWSLMTPLRPQSKLNPTTTVILLLLAGSDCSDVRVTVKEASILFFCLGRSPPHVNRSMLCTSTVLACEDNSQDRIASFAHTANSRMRRQHQIQQDSAVAHVV